MSEEPLAPEDQPRAGRVSRIPLLVVVAVLVLVAAIGAFATRNRDDKLVNASTAATSTTSTAAPTSLTPTSIKAATTTATPGGTAASTTAVPAGGQDCTSAALLASVKASGQVDPSIVNTMQVASFKCVDPYAKAHLTAPNAGDVDAYFVRANSAWRMLVLGTSLSPQDYGVPSGVIDQLQ